MILLVGERMRRAAVPRWDEIFQRDLPRWLRISRHSGAFGERYQAAAKLRAVLGLRWDAALNLLPPSPRAGEWDARAAFRSWLALRELLEEWQVSTVVCCGRRVEAAARAERHSYCSPVLTDQGRYYITVPHPSGQCRFWNEPAVVERAANVLRATSLGVPGRAPTSRGENVPVADSPRP